MSDQNEVTIPFVPSQKVSDQNEAKIYPFVPSQKICDENAVTTQFLPSQIKNDDIVITIQPQPQIVSSQGTREWSSGLLNMGDDQGICLCVLCCGSCYSCYLSSKMGESCCVPVFVGLIPLRQKLRMLLGIRGSICEDYCTLAWCGYCALCQMAREMKTAGYDIKDAQCLLSLDPEIQ